MVTKILIIPLTPCTQYAIVHYVSIQWKAIAINTIGQMTM